MLAPIVHRWSIAIAIAYVSVACASSESSTPLRPTVTTTSPPTMVPSTTTTSTTTSTTISTTTSTTVTPTTTAPSTTPTTTPSTTPIIPTTTAIPATKAPSTSTAPTTSPAGPSVAVGRLPSDARVVALTFDAGSDLGFLGQILDVLAQQHVAASFGITGTFAEEHPEDVRRIAREGHLVINHSYSHASFTGFSSDDVLASTADRQADLERADAVLHPLVGHSTVPYWRPPFGDHDPGVLADVGAIGYRWTVLWTVDSLGWRGLTADQIIERVLGQVTPGAIVLMHVGSQSADAAALPNVIESLRDDGYSFATVADGLGD